MHSDIPGMENACSFLYGDRHLSFRVEEVGPKTGGFTITSLSSQDSKMQCFPSLADKNYLKQLLQNRFPGLRWSPGICIFSQLPGDPYHCHKAKVQNGSQRHHIIRINRAATGKCTLTCTQLGSHWDSWLRISSSSQDVKHTNECVFLIITHNGFLLHVLGECHMPRVPGSRKPKY